MMFKKYFITAKFKKETNNTDKNISQAFSEASCSNSVNMERVQSNNSSDNEAKYTGFDQDTIQCITEQFIHHQTTEEARSALAEDISYRMKDILFAATINMRQLKRNFLKIDDIDAVFRRFNIEKIYGPALPNWIPIGGDPDNFFCIPKVPIDLVEIATAEATFTEPGDIGVEYKWLKDTSLFNHMLVDNSLNNYSEKIMKAAISNRKPLRKLALKDVSANINIGPIIAHLCNFCFLILQKNITYSNLATPALQLLEAILFNPCTSYSIEDAQMTLLIYLLLENIMNATNSMLNEIYPVCRTLGRLCVCWPHGTHIVIEKIKKHLPEDQAGVRLTAPVICSLTFIGNEALNALLWPHIVQLFKYMRNMASSGCLELRSSILTAAYLFYEQNEIDINTDHILRMEFGHCLVPFWKLHVISPERNTEDSIDELIEKNSIETKVALLKTLIVHSEQDISNRLSQYNLIFRKPKPHLHENISITISGFNSLPTKRKHIETDKTIYEERPKYNTSVKILTGRRTLCCIKKMFSQKNTRKSNIRDYLYML